MPDLMFDAMTFARDVHANQTRKYTGNPYTDHLAEVAGIAAMVGLDLLRQRPVVEPGVFLAVCWLHDSMEDQDVAFSTLWGNFGLDVAKGVEWLSDLETGNRAERKAASRNRLAKAPGWVQTIKCADLISNTSSIVKHDPKFAITYLDEKRMLLEVLSRADPRLREMAGFQVERAISCATSEKPSFLPR